MAPAERAKTGPRPALLAYLATVIATGLLTATVGTALFPPLLTRDTLVLALLVAVLNALALAAPVRIALGRNVILDTAVQTVALTTFAPPVAGALCGAGILLGNRLHLHRKWLNAGFNASQVVISVCGAGLVYTALHRIAVVRELGAAGDVLALLPAGLALFLLSDLAVDVASGLQRRRSPFVNWFATRRDGFLAHMALVAAGAITAPAIDKRPWLVIVVVGAAALVRSMLQQSSTFNTDLRTLAERLADEVDAHLPAGGWSRRAAQLAPELARAHGLDEAAAQRLALAARLSNTGAALLQSNDPAETVQPEPWQEAEAAARWVREVLHLPDVAESLRFQHETFDGQGGPLGLRGMEIPLESRLVSVITAWVRLTSPTEHRPALSEAQALALLRAGAGSQWDPACVASLVTALQAMETGGREPVALPSGSAVVR